MRTIIIEINLRGENVKDLEFQTFVLCKHNKRFCLQILQT